MTISIWRYCHLTLAIFSSIFIFIASITGIILAFEPISNQLESYKIENANQLSLSKTILVLEEKYDDIITIKVDENDFVIASVITKNGKSDAFYINPFSGEKIGNLIEKKPIFKFATSLHRSLFLKSTGRFIIGFVSFLLFLMAITGIILIAKRQGGIHRFFSKVIQENFEQYYHIIIGKYTLIPIVIITLTGVYLSLEKFSLLPDQKITHLFQNQENSNQKTKNSKEIDLFNTIYLQEVKSVEFPFSDDEEDYFFIKQKDNEFYVNQYSGEIVSQQKYPATMLLSNWSLLLHTGQGSIIWSIILLLSCIALLFFIYSGFAMTLKRKKTTLLPKNSFDKDNAEYIILVGSETGSTFSFATIFYNSLKNSGKSVYISDLNSYTNYKKAQHLILFTATYGEGDAPNNATNFEQLFKQLNPKKNINYAVLGFGSLKYTAFCKYAIYVDSMLQAHPNFLPIMQHFKVNNQSFEAFKTWTQAWSKRVNIPLEIPQNKLEKNTIKKYSFEVLERTNLNSDNTFLLKLKPTQKIKFESGDLLAFTPKSENVTRYYSIGKLNGDILVSVKKHDLGICSSYFSELNKGNSIAAAIQNNEKFHFPKKSKEVILIANGTGIGPFLGMINANKKKRKVHLFWGIRTKSSYSLYENLIDKWLKKNLLTSLQIAYSRENNQKTYVQDLILEKAGFIANVLQKGGTIMICGSIKMQNQVLENLQQITMFTLKTPLKVFENNGQIKTDCY